MVMSASLSIRSAQRPGWPYIIDLVISKFLDGRRPPDKLARVNGAGEADEGVLPSSGEVATASVTVRDVIGGPAAEGQRRRPPT